jgi:PAS domain S-box-containing protein
MSKTDEKGIIEYANDYFMEICKYEEYELMGQPHNVIRHPDMPKVVFKLLWQRLFKGENIHALVKNLAKDGSYYWVLTNFETKYDKDGKIVSHYSRRKAAPGNAVFLIEKIYKTLVAIENTQGADVSEKYFYGLLEEKGQTYDEFILEILGVSEKSLIAYFKDASSHPKEKKRGLFGRMFR